MLLAPDYLAMLRRMSRLTGPSKKRVIEVSGFVLDRLIHGAEDEGDSSLANMRQHLNENATPPSAALTPLLDAAENMDQTLVQPEPEKDDAVQYTWPESVRDVRDHAQAILRSAPTELRQSVLDTLARASNVQNPLGYLAGLVERARKGLFVDMKAQNRRQSMEADALSDALDAARLVLAAGRRVTIRGHDIEEIVASGLIKRSDRDGYAQAFSLGIRPEDIDIENE